MTDLLNREAQVLERITPELEAEGYSVYVRPSVQLLPAFLQNYSPDAIALGRPKNLAIEIVSENPHSKGKIERIKKQFEGVNDWELRVYYVRPTDDTGVEVPTREATAETLRIAETLLQRGEVKPALLMAWAALEALGRSLLPQHFSRPQTPGRLVEVLASEGYVKPTQADVLRRLVAPRNTLIHGGLGVEINSAELTEFLAIEKSLHDQLGRGDYLTPVTGPAAGE
jgi:uncharacterized protein YutE (UPF0331/DUF86 family)